MTEERTPMARSGTESSTVAGQVRHSQRPPGGVQSVERAFDMLRVIAAAGGQATLGQIATAVELPMATNQRLLKTLVGLGVVRKLPKQGYALAPELVRLGELATSQLGPVLRPHLRKLVNEIGESANVVSLDGDRVVYIAQLPSPHQLRMFTEVGRRARLHATGAGKAILAQLSAEKVHDILSIAGMPAHTEHSITTVEELTEELNIIRRHGYSIDDEEEELGVRCFAVAVPLAPTPLAISISGPTTRVDQNVAERAVPLLKRAAQDISDEMAESGSLVLPAA